MQHHHVVQALDAYGVFGSTRIFVHLSHLVAVGAGLCLIHHQALFAQYGILVLVQCLSPYGIHRCVAVELVAQFACGGHLRHFVALIAVGLGSQIADFEVRCAVAVPDKAVGSLAGDACHLGMSALQVDVAHHIYITDGTAVQLSAYSSQSATVGMYVLHRGIHQTEVLDLCTYSHSAEETTLVA